MALSKSGCACGGFVAATEAAAVAAAKLLGLGDPEAADRAARAAMAAEFDDMPIRGRVVAGRSGSSEPGPLSVGAEVGSHVGPWMTGKLDAGYAFANEPDVWDLAVDPLQAPNSLARGIDGALTMLAAGPAGSLMPVPEMYMQKLVVPRVAADVVDLDALVSDNLRAIATALGRRPADLTVIVLDRPRHEELVSQIRQTGARVRLITDGDVSGGLAVVTTDYDVDVCMGIGGSTEGILTAAALRCTGGEMQARFWPVSRQQVELVRAAGIEDLEARLTSRDMAGDGTLVVATAVTNGRFLKGVETHPFGVLTHSIVFCSRCGAIRKIHNLRRSETGGAPVRLGID